jgi:hypothetical protein
LRKRRNKKELNFNSPHSQESMASLEPGEMDEVQQVAATEAKWAHTRLSKVVEEAHSMAASVVQRDPRMGARSSWVGHASPSRPALLLLQLVLLDMLREVVGLLHGRARLCLLTSRRKCRSLWPQWKLHLQGCILNVLTFKALLEL